jgi:hypothetical protein
MSGIPAWASPGKKVVCVNTGWVKGTSMPLLMFIRGMIFGYPIAGGVYVVTKAGWGAETHAPVIELRGWRGYFFQVVNFRPPVDEEALQRDVALFRNLITHPVDA